MLDFSTFWVSIQSLVLRRCASTSLSGLPAISGLKCDQLNCGIGAGLIGCEGGATSCAGGASSCTGGTGGTTGGTIRGGWVAGGLPSAMSNYIVDHATSEYNSNPNLNFNLVDSNWIYKWTKV